MVLAKRLLGQLGKQSPAVGGLLVLIPQMSDVDEPSLAPFPGEIPSGPVGLEHRLELNRPVNQAVLDLDLDDRVAVVISTRIDHDVGNAEPLQPLAQQVGQRPPQTDGYRSFGSNIEYAHGRLRRGLSVRYMGLPAGGSRGCLPLVRRIGPGLGLAMPPD